MASALLLDALLLGMLAAPVAVASSGTPCLVRNITQGTSSRSFRVVVTLAHDGDRLEVRGTCHPRGIAIDRDLDIRGVGVGATLDGQARYRVLRIARGAVVTLRHLVLTHGRPVSYDSGSLPGGGAISNRGTLTLIDSLVTVNDAYVGGGIYNIGTLTLIHSRVTEHGTTGFPDDEGDAIQGVGGGIFNIGTATLVDSVVAHNHTDNGGGGIVNGGTMTLRNSRVSDNGSNYMGNGGIGNGGTLLLVDSRVTRNSGYDGGGIGNAGTVRLTGSRVSRNTSFRGGGIFNDRRGTVTLSGGSRVTGNASVSVGNPNLFHGGGILNRGSLTLRDSMVTANTATDRGGGIFNSRSGTVTLRGSAGVTGNTPDDCVGTPAC